MTFLSLKLDILHVAWIGQNDGSILKVGMFLYVICTGDIKELCSYYKIL